MENKYQIQIASIPDKDLPVVEIGYCNYGLAEISSEKNKIIIEIFNHPEMKSWNLDYDEFLEVLKRARERL